MADSILTATVAIVEIGNYEFEGLLFDNGKFGIAVPQVCSIFQFLIHNASRDIKALLGNDFQFLKCRTTLNPKDLNVLQLTEFETLIRKLDRKGNEIAQNIVDGLVGLSLNQVFSDAFNIKFEKEERQAYLLNRPPTKQTFKQLNDHIKNWIDQNPDESPNTKKFIYCHTYDVLNKGLFGKSSKKIKEELGIGKEDLNRDYFNSEALARVDMIQRLAKGKIASGMNPKLAVEKSISEFCFEVIDYKA